MSTTEPSLPGKVTRAKGGGNVATRSALFVLAAAGLSIAILAPLAPAAGVAGAGAREGADYFNTLPTQLPLDVPLAQHTVLLDRNGKEYARFFAEDRTIVPLDQISKTMTDALLATEDDRFYEHGAYDPQGLARAMARNVLTDSRQGGSTLTQQLVENVLLSTADNGKEVTAARAQSPTGKIQELRYAIELEKTLTKDQILERYLNTVYFGQGAYGVGSAAKRYFNTTADKLTLDQAAILAGLMKSPTNYDPITKPDRAKERRDTVLGRMLSTKRITQAEHDAAVATPIATNPTKTPSGCSASTYPLYCAYVRDELLTNPVFGATPEAREGNLYRGGLTITTALDPKASDAAMSAATKPFAPENRVTDGLAVVEPGTGYIAALAQSKPYGQGPNETEIVYATRPFQPGSSFKPITLTAAVEQGFNPNTTISAPTGYKPAKMDSPKGGFKNDSNANYGDINAYQATKNSVNTWYVKLIERTGVIATADMAARLGVTSLPRTGKNAIGPRQASLTLGAYEVSPLEMASVYATIAAHGVNCKPTAIVAATRTSNGQPVTVPDTACHQAISPEVANTVADVLQQPLTPGGTAGGLGLDRPAGGKTGTTNGNAATWFVGFTPQYATAVWVGDPRGGVAHPLVNSRQDPLVAYGSTRGKLYGATVAAPVWHDTMQALSNGLPVLPLTAIPDKQVILRTRTIPDVRGMSTEAAMTSLIGAGYQVTINPTDAAPNDLLAPDHVIDQTPHSGMETEAGAQISLTLTNGSRHDVKPPVAPAPTTEGNTQ